MFERYQQQGAAGKEDEMLRRMLFGSNNRRPAARPVMESVSPSQSPVSPEESENEPSFACLNACSLAMVYSPEQNWQNVYPVEKALLRGTLFRDLDKPFEGRTLLGR